MKVKESIKKVGAAAASTLMVGMTLGSAATLADFPGMFIADDGTPTAQVVVGSSGAVSDVVGAVNVAAALGQATVQTSEQTKTVDVATSGNVGWSAQNGQMLDTVNDNLYYSSKINDVRQTLTSDHLDLLSDSTFQTEDGTSINVEHYLKVGDEDIKFGVPAGVDNQDPFLYVDTVGGSSVSGTNYLYELQANFEDSLDFQDTSDSQSTKINENVVGQDVELFGDTFSISKDSFSSGNEGQLVLFGSSQETTLQTGQSQTMTIDGQDFTFNVVAVTDSQTAAFRVGGQLREKTEGSSFTLNGQTIRVDDVIQTSDSNSAGYVTFSLGSQKVVLEDGQPVMTGQDETDVEGTHVNLKGNLVDGANTVANNDIQLSSIQISVGADDSDNAYVQAGNSFSDPVFGGLAFRFGGLAPDAASGGDNVGQIQFKTSGDETVTTSYTPQGADSSTSLEWAYDNNADGSPVLSDGDGNDIVVQEGSPVGVDEYFAADAGGFPHIYQVTSVDVADSDGSTAEDGTISLNSAVGSSSLEIDVTETGQGDGTTGNSDVFTGTEVIDGQTYYFRVNDDGTPTVEVTWGAGAEMDGDSTNGPDTGDMTTLYAAQDTDSGAALALTEKVTLTSGMTASGNDLSGMEYELVLPSTESSNQKTLTIDLYEASGGTTNQDTSADGDISLQVEDASDTLVAASGEATLSGQSLNYFADFTSGGTLTFGLADDRSNAPGFQGDSGNTDGVYSGPAAVVVEPENNMDNEHAYVVAPGTDTGNGQVEVTQNGAGSIYYTNAYDHQTLDSDDQVEVGYDQYGTYTRENTDEQGSFTLNIPSQQATAGAAFTGAGGSLSMGGGGSGTAEVTYTGVTNMDMIGNMPDIAMTDSQVTQSTRQNSDLILVGGPAVNTLVADLASQGKTWTVQEWRNQHQDEALLQVVENAFSQGNHALIVAGHSADDTRAAARYLANYGAHQSTLKGKMQYTPSSQEAPR